VSFILAQNQTAQWEAYIERCNNDTSCSEIIESDSTVFNFYMDWINCQDTWLNTTQIQAWAKVLLRDYQIEERRFRYKDAYYHDFEHKAFTDMGDKCSTM